MQDRNYWIDDDGFIAHGKGDDYTTVSGEIVPLHIAPLKAIFESHTDLLAACKELLAEHAQMNSILIKFGRGTGTDSVSAAGMAWAAIAAAEKGV